MMRGEETAFRCSPERVRSTGERIDMRRIERHRAWVRVGAVRREVVLALVILGAFAVGFGVTLLLMPEAQPVQVAASDEESAALEATTSDVAAALDAEAAQSKEALNKGQEGRVPEKDSWIVEEQVDYFKLLKDDDMNYRGYPRFRAAPQIVPRIQVTRLTGVAPAVFQFSISDTVMPGALLEHDEAVDPWRDLHVEWDFGDANCPDRHFDARYGVERNPNTDQQGPEALHVYRTPGTYTVTCTVKARTGPGQYTVASTTTVRANHYQTLCFPQASSGSFRLEFPAGSGNWTAPITLEYGSIYTSGPLGTTGYEIVQKLEALPTIGPGNVRIAQNQSVDTDKCLYWTIEFCGDLGGQSHAMIGVDKTSLVAADVPTRHSIWVQAGPSGVINSGQFRLQWSDNGLTGTTAWINYNATAATVEAAINALLGAGMVTVTGGPIGEPAEVVTNTTWYIYYNLNPWRYTYVRRPTPLMDGNWGINDFRSREDYVGHAPYSFETIVWEHQPGGSAANVTVTAGTVSTRYYDPVGGSDSNDGLTEGSPKKTWANLTAWITGASSSEYRKVLLKRGTTFSDTVPSIHLFANGLKFVRFGAYGNGAKPALALYHASGEVMLFGPTMTEASARGKETIWDDVVFDGIDLVTVSPFSLTSSVATNNHFKWAQRLYFIDCYIQKKVNISHYQANEEIAFINCVFDGASYHYNPVLYRSNWLAIQGGIIKNGAAELGPVYYQLHHAIYPIQFGHELVRWVDFQECVNLGLTFRGSVSHYPSESYFRIITDCYMRGASGGGGMGRGHSAQAQREGGWLKSFLFDGNWVQAGSDTGVWVTADDLNPATPPGSPLPTDKFYSSDQIQGCGPGKPFHYKKVGGVFSTGGVRTSVVRNCRAWATLMPATPVPIGDPQLPSYVPGTPMMFGCIAVSLAGTNIQIYNNEIDHSGVGGAILNFESGSGWYVVDNTFRLANRSTHIMNIQATPDASITNPRRRVFDRNYMDIFNENVRYPVEYPFHFRGRGTTDYKFSEAVAAGLIGPNNVKGALPWPDVKTGDFRDNHSANLGGIPVKLKRDKGWPR